MSGLGRRQPGSDRHSHGNRGNYFANKTRDASRSSGGPATPLLPSPDGSAQSQDRSYVAGSSENGQLGEHPVDILDRANSPSSASNSPGVAHFRSRMSSSLLRTGSLGFSSRLALDFGVRVDSQDVSEAFVWRRGRHCVESVCPYSTLVQAGYGCFRPRPLNVYCFNKFPDQSITMYGADGQVSPGHFSI